MEGKGGGEKRREENTGSSSNDHPRYHKRFRQVVGVERKKGKGKTKGASFRAVSFLEACKRIARLSKRQPTKREEKKGRGEGTKPQRVTTVCVIYASIQQRWQRDSGGNEEEKL